MQRRELLNHAFWTAAIATTGLIRSTSASADNLLQPSNVKRIATEEGFLTPEVFGAHLELLANSPEQEPGFAHFWETALGVPGLTAARLSSVLGGEGVAGVIDFISSTVAATGSKSSVTSLSKLMDIDQGRIDIMDEVGVTRQVISLASPGVQVFDADIATELAKKANDRLAEATQKHPDRFSGLAAIAPQNPEAAAKELKRAISELGLKGVVINSHTKGEYLDEEKFIPILEAAHNLRVPIYLHPRTPSPAMIEPFTAYSGLAAATFGFSVETSLHAIRLMLSGRFDDFPNLTVILGHMGEGLPFWIDRIDNRTAFIQTGPGEKLRPLQKKPSEYLKENFYITTSGMDFEPALMLAHRVVGPDRIMFAIDHPMEDGIHPIHVMDNAPISEEDRAKIYHKNAEQLFGLPT